MGLGPQLVGLYGETAGTQYYRSFDFAVHPDYQGKGIGSALHRYVAEKVSQYSCNWESHPSWLACLFTSGEKTRQQMDLYQHGIQCESLLSNTKIHCMSKYSHVYLSHRHLSTSAWIASLLASLSPPICLRKQRKLILLVTISSGYSKLRRFKL